MRLTSPDISKVYTCVLRPAKSTLCTLYKHISLKLMVKFINFHMKENVHRDAHALTGVMFAPSVILFS